MFKKTLFICYWWTAVFTGKVTAQKVQYSSENIGSNYSDNLQVVADISGNHHLISFTSKERPEIFIFNQQLKFLVKTKLPFKFPERAEFRIIPFADFYYFCIYSPLSKEYFFWKIDGDGNLIDLTTSFKKLVQSQSHNLKRSFQLIANEEKLLMVYHTALTNTEKSTLVVVQTDSLLNVVDTQKVMYDFKREEEQMKQGVLMFGKYLLVLKTARSNTILELMKIDLATGYANTQIFQSSGYVYSQSSFNYNKADSTVTVSSLLTEPRTSGLSKQYLFLSRLNTSMLEQVPFTLLKSQFIKNTNTNFLLVEGSSKWMRIKKHVLVSYLGYSNPDPSNMADVSSSWESYSVNSDDGIRFSLLNKNFEIISDSLVANTKNSYTLKANEVASFGFGNKEYLLLGQQFSNRSKGLLMIHTDDKHQLVYNDVRVNGRNNYLLSKARVITGRGIIVPYTNKKEAGLIKITVD